MKDKSKVGSLPITCNWVVSVHSQSFHCCQYWIFSPILHISSRAYAEVIGFAHEKLTGLKASSSIGFKTENDYAFQLDVFYPITVLSWVICIHLTWSGSNIGVWQSSKQPWKFYCNCNAILLFPVFTFLILWWCILWSVQWK